MAAAYEKTRYAAVDLEDLVEAKPHIVEIEGRSIGIILSDGEIRAVRNLCPHKRAPICKGLVKGTMMPSNPDEFVFGMEGKVLQCPWHGWEFSLETGANVFANSRRKLTFYPTEVEDGRVYVLL